ncbi:MAG TPA: haloacid dehalogenase, partial [Candidatus Xenobia bacterium]
MTPAAYPLSRTQGRVRIHCPLWKGGDKQALEAHLLGLRGVRTAQASPATQNVLVFFDESQIAVDRLVREVAHRAPFLNGSESPSEVPVITRPSVVVHQRGDYKRARITVRGLDRDPSLGSKIVHHLQQRRPGVKVVVNPLTSRMLVEFPEHLFELEEIIAEVTHFELPGIPEEDLIHHPLDPGPLIQGTVRVVGAALGLGMIATRRLLRADQPLIPAAGPARIAGLLGLAQGFPIVRLWMRRLMGRTAADLMLFGPIVVSLALSESVLGLVLTGIESVRLLSEVIARRGAWERYEGRLAEAPSAHPGAVIRIDSGQRVPLTARIVEGTGTGTGRDGLPIVLEPGAEVSAGARLSGG